MSSRTANLALKNLIVLPSWLPQNIQYEIILGSRAYGMALDDSDEDICGFAIPPKTSVFPHLAGEIMGFGRQVKRFDQYQQHHIKTIDGTKEYDIAIFNIVKYFQLLMDNNPNVLESLYVPFNCITHITQIGQLVRDNRQKFLHKGSYYRYRGYAYQQYHKIKNKSETQGKRKELIEQYGFDTKFSSHLIRLLDYCQQILTTHDIDLQKNKEQLKAIRRGEVSLDEIEKIFQIKEKELEKLYESSTLQYSPNEEELKSLLLKCLEIHYGSLDDCIKINSKAEEKLQRIQLILEE